jgi:hypothetical protein
VVKKQRAVLARDVAAAGEQRQGGRDHLAGHGGRQRAGALEGEGQGGEAEEGEGEARVRVLVPDGGGCKGGGTKRIP